ncbi:MAG: sensor histidine kinase [Acidimicrobiales bacterium]
MSWAFDSLGALLLASGLVWGSYGEAYGKLNGNEVVPFHLNAYPHPSIAGYGLVALAALVLAGRRRWPLATFSVSLAAVLTYTGLGYVDGSAAVAPMVGLYTVASQGTWRRALAVGAVALISLWILNLAFAPFPALGGGQTVFPFVTAAALCLGIAVGNRRAYMAGVVERGVLAERTREDEARRRVDAERLRIARELHDVVAHSIAMINVQSGVAAHVIDDRPDQAKEALVAIKAASKEALRELRSILDVLRAADDTALRSPTPGLGQLDTLVSAACAAGMPTSVRVLGEARDLLPAVDLAAYRIVQESLTNALRHAGPARAAISLSYQGSSLILEVTDDGRGTPASGSGSVSGSGHGISGMRERATSVGGTLDAGPGLNGGWTVRASLPLPPDPVSLGGQPVPGVAVLHATPTAVDRA